MMELAVMTFNLRYHEVKDGENAWPYRVGKAADVIGRHRPAIVGTQEGLFPMLVELKERIDGYEWIGEGRGGGHEDEHNAIFYHTAELRVMEKGQFWLSEQPMQPNSRSWGSSLPRICTWARFQAKKDTQLEFLVYNTHLDHESQLARENGIALIRRTMEAERDRHMPPGERDRKPLPLILTGDFNATPDNPAVAFLRSQQAADGPFCRLTDAYEAADGDIGGTFHGFKGGESGEPIDYIFVSGEIRVLETKVIRDKVNGGYPSDHYPVQARLSI
jgi:endonuclease/exonuclease/phosphatase family metal-dependent hydrolase